ncbi:hypothetical protein [Hyphococcus luteus]|uniref:Uncharacterized protein n=1 Tax=Hyphococcus luteus TaxID=2058213 RepID=A0A2S7K4M8_9PROT|nr:hypothetical protein [Marinicaulis flavus]PQA87452.1 hypothetical protein CW354_11645 [Marinicaulis flavus]
MKKIGDGIAIFKKYSLFEVTGEVESETTRAETEVRGEIPSNQGPFAGRISSKTTRYQTIYLKDDDGGQYAVNLVDFVIPCREGHKLVVRGADKNLWFDVTNENTGEAYEDGSGLAKYAFPDLVVFGGAGVVAALVLLMIMMSEGGFGEKLFFGVLGGGVSGAVVFGLLWVPGRIVASMRAAQIKAKLKQVVGAYRPH